MENKSQSISLSGSIDAKQTPESTLNTQQQKINAFLALKKLKQTQAHVSAIKNRYIVLKAHEKKNINKTIHIERKLQMWDTVKTNRQRDKKQWDAQIMRRQKQAQMRRQMNEQRRKFHSEKLKNLRLSIIQANVQQKKTVRIAEKEHEQKICQMKKLDLGQKRKKCQQLLQDEEKQKINVSHFRENKINETKNSKNQEKDLYLKKATLKESEMQKLELMEQEMMKRNAQSIVAAKAMSNKMKQFIDSDKMHQRLPQISSRIAARKARI